MQHKCDTKDLRWLEIKRYFQNSLSVNRKGVHSMIKVIHSFQAKGSVIALYEGEENISFTDNKGHLYVVSKKGWGMETYLIDSEDIKPLHPYQKSSCFDAEGRLVYGLERDESCAVKLIPPSPTPGKTIQTATKGKTIHAPRLFFYGNDQRAENIAIGGEYSEYVFTGGTDGRVFVYNAQNGDVLISFKPLPDFIAHIRSSDNGQFLAYSSYNGSLHVVSLRLYEKLLQTHPGDVIEDSFFYNHSQKLYAIGRSGVSYVYSLDEKKLVSKKANFSSWPTCCVLEKNGKYGIVGTRSGHIHLVKLSDNTIAYTEKLERKGIVSLALNDTKLLIGFENGTVNYVDVYAYADEFVEALGKKDFAQAKHYLDRNLFLAIHPMSELFHEAWDEIIKEIREQFSKGNTQNALESATPFLSDAANRKEFDFLVQKQKELEKFARLVESNKYIEAFGLLEGAPYLSKTESALKLENSFFKTFSTAKKMIAADPLRNFPKAQELLKPFSAVAAKAELIRSLMKNHQIFLKADEKIKAKEFKSYFALCEQYPFLKDEAAYRRICEAAEGAIKKIVSMIDAHHYEEAMKSIRQLLSFTPYRGELSKRAQEIQLRQQMITLIDSDRMKEVYELARMHPELAKMDRFLEYEKRFDNHISQVMLYVGKGEIKQTQQMLSPYAGIPRFKPKVKECVRQASYNRIASLLAHAKTAAAKPIIAFYLKEFGQDNDFEKLLKRYYLA